MRSKCYNSSGEQGNSNPWDWAHAVRIPFVVVFIHGGREKEIEYLFCDGLWVSGMVQLQRNAPSFVSFHVIHPLQFPITLTEVFVVKFVFPVGTTYSDVMSGVTLVRAAVLGQSCAIITEGGDEVSTRVGAARTEDFMFCRCFHGREKEVGSRVSPTRGTKKQNPLSRLPKVVTSVRSPEV